MKPEDEILKKSQAAILLGLSIRSLERAVASRLIPVIRYGTRCIRFRRSDIDAYIHRHLIAPQETQV